LAARRLRIKFLGISQTPQDIKDGVMVLRNPGGFNDVLFNSMFIPFIPIAMMIPKGSKACPAFSHERCWFIGIPTVD
jgi:hypothetical protein